ncbi:rhodanese-like domain-containing protein [Labilibacter sediminis]|nr:rhodanese-like domain-containing protein [Labilibacter sediminis]
MLNRYIFLIVILRFTVASAQEIDEDRTLNTQQFYEKILTTDNGLIFDIRVPNLFEESRIVDAQLADTKNKLTTLLKDVDKKTPLFIYCQVGKRTKQCILWLDKLGYTRVYHLQGGFKEWKKNGMPIDSTIIE